MKPQHELADIVHLYKDDFIAKHQPFKQQLQTLHAIERCRTAALGFHIDQCDNCNNTRVSYNSCRNRHCPKCQTTNRENWIASRKNDLLPVRYFHVVFTIPHELNAFCLKYPSQLYNILFEASAQTIADLGKDAKLLGAQMGMISVLHTWGQNLSLHPHVHMIVPAGGVGEDGKWSSLKGKGDYLFPFGIMRTVFRGKFMEKCLSFLSVIGKPMEAKLRRTLYNKQWNVYARQPFAGPEQVIEYLGRYSHKIAISNHRIKSISNKKIRFSYKDYADNGKQKQMTLEADEFLRRFCLHILPPSFRKIRHYGILSNRNKERLHKLQMQAGVTFVKEPKKHWKEIARQKLNFDPDQCPCCKTGKMIRVMSYAANPPPKAMALLQNFINKTEIKK